MTRLLLLAGTAEARALATALAARPEIETLASLAGATRAPAPYPVPTRRGGFGGAAGLAAFLRAARIDLLVDATHPFAARMQANAAEAAGAVGLPRLRLSRPPWAPGPGDRWRRVADAEAAAAALPPGASAFLATGPGSLAPFLARRDLRLALRVVDPTEPPPGRPDLVLVTGRPPFRVEDEIAALQAQAATHLVCKNAGGEAGAAKLLAARALALPVVMIERPAAPETAPRAESVAAALAWIEARLRRGTSG